MTSPGNQSGLCVLAGIDAFVAGLGVVRELAVIRIGVEIMTISHATSAVSALAVENTGSVVPVSGGVGVPLKVQDRWYL